MVLGVGYKNTKTGECKNIQVVGPIENNGIFSWEKIVVPDGWEKIVDEKVYSSCDWTGDLEFRREKTFVGKLYIGFIAIATFTLFSLPAIALVKVFRVIRNKINK